MFTLGRHSRRELNGVGVHPDLVRVVERAIGHTVQDFTVFDGLRTEEEQRGYVRAGVSRTMVSMHLVQPDGYGHAVDLVPYINGKLRWELEATYGIADAVREAADHFAVRVVWGGCWEALNDIHGDLGPSVLGYTGRRLAAGFSPFVDAVHYELSWGT